MKKTALLLIMMLLPTFADAGKTIINIGNVWYSLYPPIGDWIDCVYAAVIANPDGNEKYAGQISVPASIEYEGTTYPVAGIAAEAFYECPDLISVSVAGSIIHIGERAFAYCPNLTSVVIPDSIAKLCDHAFDGCANLSYITLPRHLPEIGSACFAGCGSLTSFPLPASLKSIGEYAFYKCGSLASPMMIPEGVQTIPEYAFFCCKSIPRVSIPNSVTTIEWGAFQGCSSLEDLYLPEGIRFIDSDAFSRCGKLTKLTIPSTMDEISSRCFQNCTALETIILPESMKYISIAAFGNLTHLKDVYCHSENVPKVFYTYDSDHAFSETNLSQVTLHVPEASIDNYRAKSPWNQFGAIVPLEAQPAYRPVVEDGKVWKVGHVGPNPVQLVEYYYFEGDTIVEGKTCKQMMCQRFVSPEHPDDDADSPYPALSYVGAWYEEGQKVYAYDSVANQFKLMYDFSLADNGTIQIDGLTYVAGPRQTEGLQGFKGVYRDVRLWADGESIYSPAWLEGVGSIDGPTINVYPGYVDPAWFLMSCTVDDEVIYLNDEFEDGATPEGAGARNRFDFTHTIKIQPKLPMRREAERPLYGEYGELQLHISLGPLSDTYLVNITDETGKAVYEKTINTSSIVGLSINISAFPKGCYTVVVENSQESFVGQFEAQAAGIEEIGLSPACAQDGGAIYNLQGQRIGSLQKGLNIVKGQKVYVR